MLAGLLREMIMTILINDLQKRMRISLYCYSIVARTERYIPIWSIQSSLFFEILNPSFYRDVHLLQTQT